MVKKLPDVETPIDMNPSYTTSKHPLDDSDSDSDSLIHTSDIEDNIDKLNMDPFITQEYVYPNASEPKKVSVKALPTNESPEITFRTIFDPKRILTKLKAISTIIPIAKNYQTYLMTPTIDFKKAKDKVLDAPHKQYGYILDKLTWIHLNTPHKILYMRIHPEFTKSGTIHAHAIMQFRTHAHAMMYRSNVARLLGNTKMDQINREQKDFDRSLEYINKDSADMAEVNLFPYTLGEYH